MSKRSSSWGVEVGADAIKAMHLTMRNGQVKLAGYEVIPFKRVLTTPDLNVDESIQLGLDQLLSRHDLSKSTVTVSVQGHMAFARFAKLPPVEPKKIPDIVKFEAQQQIPFPIDQVEWDYQVFAQEDSPDVEVGIFAITKERVSQFLSNYRAVKLPVDGLTLSPLAVYNALVYDMELGDDAEGLILMDIGTMSTDVIIVEGGRIWLRTLPLGGNNFTEALVRAFKLSFPKAEKLKREAGTSKYARQIFQAMRPVFADLVQEIQRSLGYYQTMNRDARLTRLVGLGSTFRLPGLQKFLKQQLQMEVDRPSGGDGKTAGFRRISADGAQAADFSEQAMNLATAYGLALQGMGLGQVQANLLPAHILRQRMWRAKQPWAMAAAAIMLVGAGVALSKPFMDSAAAAPLREKNETDGARVYKIADDYLTVFKGIELTDPRPQIENVRELENYRKLWPMLMDDFSQALAAVNPQTETLSTNRADQTKIPRGERRRMYVETYDVEDAVGTAARTGPEGMGPARDTAKPGAFTIKIKGYCPFEKAPQLITDTFVKWLQDHADDPQRPYKLVFTGSKLDIFQKGHTAPTTPGGGLAPAPENPTPPGPPTPPRLGGLGQPVRPPDAGHPAAPAGPVTWVSLLPSRPTGEEDTAGDFEFTYSWQVQLLTPAAARQREVDAAAKATTRPATQPAPKAPAAPSPLKVPSPAASPVAVQPPAPTDPEVRP